MCIRSQVFLFLYSNINNLKEKKMDEKYIVEKYVTNNKNTMLFNLSSIHRNMYTTIYYYINISYTIHYYVLYMLT